MLGAAIPRHREVIATWLFERLDLDHPDVIELALATTPELPTDITRALYQRVLDLVARNISAAEADRSLDDRTGDDDTTVVTPATIDRIADWLARWLGQRGIPIAERLEFLGVLGLHGPEGVLGTVVMSIGQALRQADDAVVGATETGADPSPTEAERFSAVLRQDLVAVLRRSLESYDDRAGPLGRRTDYDEHLVAFGAVALMADAPREMGQLLAERIWSHPQQPIPAAWRNDLTPLLREKPLDDVADALEVYFGAGGGKDTGVESNEASQTRRAVLDLLQLLRGDEPA